MQQKDKVTIVKQWCSGDYVYGAIRTQNYPSGVHFSYVDGVEYPVAQLNPLACNEYSIARWVKRSELFPEPIKGFNF